MASLFIQNPIINRIKSQNLELNLAGSHKNRLCFSHHQPNTKIQHLFHWSIYAYTPNDQSHNRMGAISAQWHCSMANTVTHSHLMMRHYYRLKKKKSEKMDVTTLTPVKVCQWVSIGINLLESNLIQVDTKDINLVLVRVGSRQTLPNSPTPKIQSILT